jgi:hypothetical protein
MKTWSNAKGDGKLFSIDMLDESGWLQPLVSFIVHQTSLLMRMMVLLLLLFVHVVVVPSVVAFVTPKKVRSAAHSSTNLRTSSFHSSRRARCIASVAGPSSRPTASSTR